MRNMKKKVTLAVSIAIIALAISFAIVGYDYWSQHRQLDTSWVEEVNQMLQNVQPYPNGTKNTDPNVLMPYCRTYLFENGTSELIEFGNADKDYLISTHLNSLLRKVDVHLGAVSDEFLDKVFANGKVLMIDYRLSTMHFGGQQRFYRGYFILEDNLAEGTAGTIIAGEVGKKGSAFGELPNRKL
jgi:hypothetical protein